MKELTPLSVGQLWDGNAPDAYSPSLFLIKGLNGDMVRYEYRWRREPLPPDLRKLNSGKMTEADFRRYAGRLFSSA
jgi:hypothetical protein